MRASAIEIITSEGSCELRAHVESDRDSDDTDWFAPFAIWYRFPGWCALYLDVANGDPFLAALLVPAMRLDERLTLPAPISALLREALPDIQAIYRAFDPRSGQIAVDAQVTARRVRFEGARRVGLFFSMGVDSFYSLLKNGRDHPNDARTVTHLISVHGFDVAHDGWDAAFPPQLLSGFGQVAGETGKMLMPVVTNVRDVCGRFAPWVWMHGAAMASVALALGDGLHRAVIAASTTYGLLAPWGTHPVLDPRWSTERLEVMHDGCELGTIEKTRFVAQAPLVLETLRVCPGFEGGYNCGRCMKCLRTMIDLSQIGMLDQCRTPPHTIDAQALRVALRMPAGPVHVANFRQRLETYQVRHERPDLQAVLAEHVSAVDLGTRPVPRPPKRRFGGVWPWR